MNSIWLTRVDAYLSELHVIALGIDELIGGMKLDTEGLDAAEVDRGCRELTESLLRLETKVAERESLLHADDAPATGVSLSDKVSTLGDEDAKRTASRCREVAGSIANAHERAVALFVCQLNLAQFSSELVRTISRQDPEPTYQSPQQAEKRPDLSGGLLDEAA